MSIIRHALILVLALLCGAWTHGDGAAPFQRPLKIGAGGWLVGGDVNPDGTRLARTDTYGAYIWQPNAVCSAVAGCWAQLVTQSSMPAANFGYFPTTGTSQINQNGGGVYEICSAPGNSSIIYMMFNGWIFKSINKGATWTKTNFGGGTQVSMATNGVERMNGRKMAVDPINPSIVYAGTDVLGMFVTVDGGTTWTAVSGVPTASGTLNYNIAFDPSSAPIAGATGTIYASFNDASTGAVYVSTDAGATWTATTSGPLTVTRMVVAPTGGTVWATDGAASQQGFIWSYSAGTWTKYTAQGSAYHSITFDPGDVTSHTVIAGTSGGALNKTTNNGSSWSGVGTFSRSATDVPWLQVVNEFSMSNGDMIFDPTTSQIVFFEGIGAWTTPLGFSNPNTWTSTSAGVEQLVSRQAIAPNGVALAGVSDRATFQLANPTAYPANTNATYNNSFPLNVTWGLDYASTNSGFMAAVIGDINSATNNNSGFSTDGGSTWKPFNSYYQTLSGTNVTNNGGLVQINVPTAGLSTWSAGSGTIVRVVSYPGVNLASTGTPLRRYWPVTVDDATHLTLQGSTYSSALSTSTNNYYVYVDTNPLTSNDLNYTVTGTASDGGLIKISVTSTSSAMVDGTIVCLSGVGGTTEANGCWTSINTNNGTSSFSLFGSVFTHAWTSGGLATKVMPPGGNIAVSTPLNMIMMGSNQDYPQCTTDGGLTWSEIHFPAGLTPGATTGWVNASFLNRHIAAADRVTANTFYLYNSNVGTYVVTNCGPPTLNATVLSNSNFSATMVAIPGLAQHLLFAIGGQGSAGSAHPTGGALRWSSDGGATWVSIANTAEPRGVAAGAIAPGSDHPTIYMVGWLSNDYGVWRSTSTAAQWAANTVSWTKISSYPLGSMDGPTTIAADGLIWNRWYLGWNGSGFTYGQQNYLLKRDLDPANDNLPVGLNAVA